MKIFGIHIKNRNSALSSSKPHISIGWSGLGDLSHIKNKEELKNSYKQTYYNATLKSASQDISQISMFLFDMKIGDYVAFSDYNIVHIGKIKSDYYFSEMDCQDPDYKNNRDVEWLGHYQTSEFSRDLRHSFGAARSVYVIDSKYEREIKRILSEDTIKNNRYFKELSEKDDTVDAGADDPSYRLMSNVIEEYSHVDIARLDQYDLEVCYFSVIGTWKSSYENKKLRIGNGNLPQQSKDKLFRILDDIEKNNDRMGLFGTGFQTCKSIEQRAAQAIIKMLVDVHRENDEIACIEIARNALQERYKRINTGMVSVMLHCLKPAVFPVINNAVKRIFNLIGIGIRDDVLHYADSVEIIRQFRNKHLNFKNYRVLDWFAVTQIDEQEADSSNSVNGIDTDDDQSTGDCPYALNTILYGPPGTGKTYSTVIRALSIIDGLSESGDALSKDEYAELKNQFDDYVNAGQIVFTTFHQSYGYEEFIEGIRPFIRTDGTPDELKYVLHDGIFKRFCGVASEHPENKYVFIIDEINRGNISKIFGELITLIEPSKRIGADEETRCLLPYSGTKFGVPKNVYILGTMNTADRSLIQLDTALRRRFEFEEMMPKSDLLNVVDDIDVSKLLEAINDRICILLDREHQIGHSYFMKLDENSTIDDIKKIFKNSIIPLLQEYFYDDYNAIADVLGEKFIDRTKAIRLHGETKYKVELKLPDAAADFIKIYDNDGENNN